jgi:hypothetical protein
MFCPYCNKETKDSRIRANDGGSSICGECRGASHVCVGGEFVSTVSPIHCQVCRSNIEKQAACRGKKSLRPCVDPPAKLYKSAKPRMPKADTKSLFNEARLRRGDVVKTPVY